MPIMKSAANKDAVGETRTQPAPRKTPTAVQKFSQYREAKGGSSGRTSSSKAMTGPKAGRGSAC